MDWLSSFSKMFWRSYKWLIEYMINNMPVDLLS